ncbi:nuclear transport factor 2 family protein [Chitinophaga sp. 212800010-3]|uniref:YybH family protein n=1 Tax=unclassified Chitinophaga TaxID=2619133 RepID=UPI002DE2432C|nr:DUF4440 domain-containing protein [Chitinophaga sp. 212800010-3]
MMKIALSALLCCQFFFGTAVLAQTAADRASLNKATAAIRDAFARGDVAAITALHHPDVVKYFGGKNVVNGRTELTKGLRQMFANATMEFIGNEVESSVITGTTAIETSIFEIKVTPKSGGAPTISRGRSMVVYVKDESSPTGWLSLREMAQEAPPKE